MENETVTDNASAEETVTGSVNTVPEVEKSSSVACSSESLPAQPTGSSIDTQNSANNAGGSDLKGGKDKDRDKINILLKPVGDAPILKNKLWSVPSERLVSQITEFVKKYLKLEKHQNLFFFINQLFAPAPDQCLRDLYECFGSDGKLVLHYSTTVAWG